MSVVGSQSTSSRAWPDSKRALMVVCGFCSLTKEYGLSSCKYLLNLFSELWQNPSHRARLHIINPRRNLIPFFMFLHYHRKINENLVTEIYHPLKSYCLLVIYCISYKTSMNFIFFICKMGHKTCNSYHPKGLGEEKKAKIECVLCNHILHSPITSLFQVKFWTLKYFKSLKIRNVYELSPV